MDQFTSLYMFAIMPPPDLAAKIHNERLNFAEEFKFVKALKPPVHITLYPPFKIPISLAPGFENAIKHLQHWADKQVTFDIQLKDYEFFKNKYKPVVYIQVTKNELLNTLNKSFLIELAHYLQIEKSKVPFKPHFTIGYRDVDPEVFPAIMDAYSKRLFSGHFICNSIYLWKHNRENWQVLHEFPLRNIKVQQSLF